MKAFSCWAMISLPLLVCIQAAFAEDPTISGPWAELRKAPLFAAETVPLAKTWGPVLPIGTAFQVEKVYGRWIYGKPTPPKYMKPTDFARSGWVFGRMLTVPGDSDTLSAAMAQRSRALLFHAYSAWKKLGMEKEPATLTLDFLESLTLSRNTLASFIRQDETYSGMSRGFPWVPSVQASEETAETTPALGLTGTELSFLAQEIKVLQEKRNKVEKRRREQILMPPRPPALDDANRIALLGRFMLQKYLDLPPLSMEEIDGFLYMRATALRALQGCPNEVQRYWKNRRWNIFRVFRLKSRPEIKHPWFEVSLPGGYFAVSGRAIELAGNEAELAFLLVRPFARELRISARRSVRIAKKDWPQSLLSQSEEVWEKVLRAQSTKDAENLDVSDEIAVDLVAAECIAKAGYRPLAGLAYLRKLTFSQEEPWASWFVKHSIGLDYRMERVLALTQEAVAKQKFPDGKVSNTKRFEAAARQWNLLP